MSHDQLTFDYHGGIHRNTPVRRTRRDSRARRVADVGVQWGRMSDELGLRRVRAVLGLRRVRAVTALAGMGECVVDDDDAGLARKPPVPAHRWTEFQ